MKLSEEVKVSHGTRGGLEDSEMSSGHRCLLAQLYLRQPAATPAPATAVLATCPAGGPAPHDGSSPAGLPNGLESNLAPLALDGRDDHGASNACPGPDDTAVGPRDWHQNSQPRQAYSSVPRAARGRATGEDAGAPGTGRCTGDRSMGLVAPRRAASGQSTGKTTAAPAPADAGAAPEGGPLLRPPWRGPLSRSPPPPRQVGASGGGDTAAAPIRRPLSATGAGQRRGNDRAGQHQAPGRCAAAVSTGRGQHAGSQRSCSRVHGAHPAPTDVAAANGCSTLHVPSGATPPSVGSSSSPCAVARALAEAASAAALSVLAPMASLPPGGDSPLGPDVQKSGVTKMPGGGPEATVLKAGSARSPVRTCSVGVQVSPAPARGDTARQRFGHSADRPAVIKVEARGHAGRLGGADHESWNALEGAASHLPYNPGDLQRNGVPGSATVGRVTAVSSRLPAGTAAQMPKPHPACVAAGPGGPQAGAPSQPSSNGLPGASTQAAFPAVDRALQRRSRLAVLRPGAVGIGPGTSSTQNAAAGQQGFGTAQGHLEAPVATSMSPLPRTPSGRVIGPCVPGPCAAAGGVSFPFHKWAGAGALAATAASTMAAAGGGCKEGTGGRSSQRSQGSTAPQDAYGAIREWRQRRAEAAAVICAAARRFLNRRAAAEAVRAKDVALRLAVRCTSRLLQRWRRAAGARVRLRLRYASLALISAAAHTAAAAALEAAAEAEPLVEAVRNSEDPRAAGARLSLPARPVVHGPRATSAGTAAGAGWLAGGCLRDLGPGLAAALARACFSDTLGGVAGVHGITEAVEDSGSGSSSPRSCSSNSSSMRDVQSRLLHANAAARDHATEVWEGDAWGRYGLVRGWGPVALSRRRYCRVVGGALAETAGRYGLAAAHRRWWLLRAAWCGLALEAVAPLPQP